MDSRLIKLSLLIILTYCFVLTAVSLSYADERRESRHGFGRGYEHAAGREERGEGASGQIAAWLFVLANFPVVLSILLKASGKVAPPSWNCKEAIEKINRRQKRYLMKLHYWLNPVAVGVAIIHFLLSECKAAAIPEIGLGVMFLLCFLGLIVTFQCAPASMRKTIFRFHTNPILLIAGISILLIGHSMVD
jgi:hypothetical protein